MDAQPEVIADRAHALATCPAKAPDPLTGVRVSGAADDMDLRRARLAAVVQSVGLGFDQLSDDERAFLWLDQANSRVVVQVTHDADAVLARMQELVEIPTAVAVELVRYSKTQLERWEQMIMGLDDIDWSSVGCEGPNDRVDVAVRGPADRAWRRITEVVEPCAFRVEGEVSIEPLDGSG